MIRYLSIGLIIALSTYGSMSFFIPIAQNLEDTGHPFWQYWLLVLSSMILPMWIVVYTFIATSIKFSGQFRV